MTDKNGSTDPKASPDPFAGLTIDFGGLVGLEPLFVFFLGLCDEGRLFSGFGSRCSGGRIDASLLHVEALGVIAVKLIQKTGLRVLSPFDVAVRG